MIKGYRAETCKRGHPFTEATTVTRKNGARRCRICTNAYNLAWSKTLVAQTWRSNNREKMIANSRKFQLSRYGLTEADYKELLLTQNNVCAICLGPSTNENFLVDHNHITGEIRGLLCRLCNTGLGSFRDSPSYLRSAIAYLEGN